ncbi:MAG: hypothetical protein COB08_002435 [Rhodobacteraceae bacterium]|nr:hypothetical protein [Paracoccaceae bacterium]
MTVDVENQTPEHEEDNMAAVRQERTFTLELVFVGVLILIVLAAILEAFTYQLVSSRTPFVAMVPLIILLVFQFFRLLRKGSGETFMRVISQARQKALPELNKVLGFVGWVALLFVTILIFGHYVGIVLFMFLLMRVVAKERLVLTLIIVFCITAILFVLFEYGFDIKLYRGLIHRYFSGYRVF